MSLLFPRLCPLLTMLTISAEDNHLHFRIAIEELAESVMSSLLPLVDTEKKARLAAMLLEHLAARTDFGHNSVGLGLLSD